MSSSDLPAPPVPGPPLAGAPSAPPPEMAHRRPLLALSLFLLTVLTTLAVGAQFEMAYVNNEPLDFFDANPFAAIARDPALLLLGIPFSFTLLGILLAHELGHYFACRYYGIAATYPYFIPAPTLIGTLGAFIRIRSPIVNRKALFDVGLAGPVVGFLFALPALALAIVYSKRIPAEQLDSAMVFGQPLLAELLAAVLRPGVPAEDIFLHPVGRAAWVGLFATALNLLPAGQLDGGHVVYSLASERHRRISLLTILALVPMGLLFWTGWLVFAALLGLLGFRHPALVDRGEPLDAKRRAWALAGVVIFLLCFMPGPLRGTGLLEILRY